MSDLIDAHLRYCEAAGYSDRTVTDRGKVLRRMHDELPWGLDEATVEELADWLAEPSWKSWTRYTYYTHVTGFYRWASRLGHLDYDPATALARPRKPRCVPHPVTETQLDDILTAAAEPFQTWARLAAYAGLRCCEISALDREDITENDIRVVGKGGKERVIPLEAGSGIWRSVRDLPCGPIARLRNGQRASAKNISSAALTYFATLGVRTSLHPLRHRFGTVAYRRSRNLRAVQELMGHESIMTTAGYTLVTDEERRAVIQALPTVAATG
jgi:integrase/recombinase XerD